MPKAQAARTFRVSLSSVKRYVDKANRGKSLAPKKRPGAVPKLDEKAMRLLAADLEGRPYLTLQERCDYVEAMTGLSVSRSTMCRAIARIGPTRKKGASCNRARRVLKGDLAGDGGGEGGAREARLRGRMRHAHLPGAALRLRAQRRAPSPLGALQAGQEHHAAFEHEGVGGMGPSLAVEGATTARIFETYVKEVLAPSLEPGRIVVMDNLGAHQPKRVRGLIEEKSCELLYLPAYSPDYNPIEEAFAKMKNLLRKASARTKEALVEAIGAALAAVSAKDARGFFEHAGYCPTAHLL